MTTTTAAKTTSCTIIAAAGFEKRSNAYAGKCACCGKWNTAGEGRIIRPSGGGTWEMLCKTIVCTRAYFASCANSTGTDGLERGERE